MDMELRGCARLRPGHSHMLPLLPPDTPRHMFRLQHIAHMECLHLALFLYSAPSYATLHKDLTTNCCCCCCSTACGRRSPPPGRPAR